MLPELHVRSKCEIGAAERRHWKHEHAASLRQILLRDECVDETVHVFKHLHLFNDNSRDISEIYSE